MSLIEKIMNYQLAALMVANFFYPTNIKAADASEHEIFHDITQSANVDFNHFNGMVGQFYFPEMTGSGGALFDFDNDGDLDLYLVQGNLLGKNDTMQQALFPSKQPLLDRLYRNDTDPATKKIRFTDITNESQIQSDNYGMGIATGDYNNDGWIDILITNYGKNRLLKNNGDGTFSDQSSALENNEFRWSTSATFFDYDKDGWLDLYIANYVKYDVNNKKDCYSRNSRQDYCGPAAFTPESDILYHNQGDGTFKEVTLTLLRDYKSGPGLGVTAADFNSDGWLDIYVANDGAANQLWINRQGKFFEDDGLFSGTSVNSNGQAEASMGVDSADFDNDGDEDLFMTHLMGETNTLYRNDGSGIFEDSTQAFGLGLASLPYTAFGTAWVDYDNDTFLDLLILNGAVTIIESQNASGDKFPLKQPDQLFHSNQGKSFTEMTGSAVAALTKAYVSRGASFGDIDNDGDTDIVIYNNNGPTRILQNQVGTEKHWIGFRLFGKNKISDSLGAKIEIKLKNHQSLWRRVHTDGSYCSANDPRVLFGLGENTRIDAINIYWPDGQIESVTQFKIDQYNPYFQDSRPAKSDHP